MDCKARIQKLLSERGIPFDDYHHPSAAFTALEIAELDHIPGDLFAKVVMMKVGDGFVMFVLPASMWVDIDKAKHVLGREAVAVAVEEEFAPLFPDCEVGAMPPFGQLYGLHVYVDESLAEDEKIFFQVGTHRDAIGMRYEDFERVAHPTIARFAMTTEHEGEPFPIWVRDAVPQAL